MLTHVYCTSINYDSYISIIIPLGITGSTSSNYTLATFYSDSSNLGLASYTHTHPSCSAPYAPPTHSIDTSKWYMVDGGDTRQGQLCQAWKSSV